MPTDPKPSRITQPVNELTQRAGWFLDTAHPGPHKSKRVAQRLGVSPDMAKLLRAGRGWTAARLNDCRRIFGRSFVEFVYAGELGPARPFEPSSELVEIKSRLARLEAAYEPPAPAVDWTVRPAGGALEATSERSDHAGGDMGASKMARALREAPR